MKMSPLLALPCLLYFSACAQKEVEKKSPTEKASKTHHIIQGSHYTTLLFPKGKSGLGRENEITLKSFKDQILKTNKKIKEISILAWADSEYPDNTHREISRNEVILARERANKIKAYAEEEFPRNSDIDTYNMAKRPDLISRIFQDEEYDIKEAFKGSATTATRLPDGSISYTKASKALIIVDFEGNDAN